jgi:hypothetical protein
MRIVLFVALLLVPLLSPVSASASNQLSPPIAERSILQGAGIPLDKPNVSEKTILFWASQTATTILTLNYDYNDYQKRLQKSSRSFSKAGWEGFAASMQQLRILDQIQRLKEKVGARVKGSPLLVRQGSSQGKYRWTIRMQVEITYADNHSAHTALLSLDMDVERVAVAENQDGMLITSWNMTQLAGERWRPECPPSKH